jgi:predicted ATP-grasp superfamily ATP-dependent carboligase
MTSKPGVVITGGDFQALGVLRTLAKKNIPVILLDSELCIGKYSRYEKKFYKSPTSSEREKYVNFLIELAKKEKISDWVIFPNSDEAVFILSKYKDILKEYYRIPTPAWDITQNVYIKEKTYKIAEKHNIPVPKTYYPKSLEELIGMDLQYPVVIKPSIRDNFYSKVKTKAYRINNREELIKTYKYICTVIDPSEVLIQEFIGGGPKQLFSFCPFFKNGKAATGVMARRTRQHPMDFGHATTFAETVNIPEMRELAEKFLSLIGYYGIAEVEFMKDPNNGNYKLLEVNPRVWGWHTLAIAAGVDLPYILYQDMIGEKLDVQQALNHTNWVRLLTDVPTVCLEIVKGNMKISDYIASMKGKKEFAVFSFADPLPFFVELVMIPYLWIKRGF